NAVDMAENLTRLFSPDFRVGLIHGRLPAEEKIGVMEGFRGGRIHLLVGTTVLEVGVHAPRATVMIIEHPERFGLAQLHQLRGRIGRGEHRGACFLMLGRDLPEKAVSRLEALVEHRDGFEIARADLEQRGHGEFLGLRQAGLGELDPVEIMMEPQLLEEAREAGRSILDRDPELSKPEHAALRAFVDAVLKSDSRI
ncbi:MAG: DNA helicase RecG, partial [Deltaproteobacteria bacterium]|nr:DNA helicase RecG [Deltaproteobacteria bacterium]